MIINKNSYSAIVAEVEKMANLIFNNDEVKKEKYVEVGNRKFRVSFKWNANINESVVKVEEKKYGYEEVLVWDSSKTEKSFPDYFMDYTKENIKNEVNCIVKLFLSLNEDVNEDTVKKFYEREYENEAEFTGFTVEEIKNMVEDKKDASSSVAR